MSKVYLDNNATTPVHPAVLEEMLPWFTEHFGNPSSVHGFGQEARAAVEASRRQIADCLGADPKEIVFTAGGTEADNMAVLGVAEALQDRGRHIVTTRIEHPAILKSCELLEEQGFEVTRLPVDDQGRVKPNEVRDSLRDDTILVSIMFVNNETGTIQPIREIGEMTRIRGVLLHSDAVQAVGKIPVRSHELNLDLLSLSAHKLHGPKGVGALYIREGTPLSPRLVGGGQERNRRGGTENVAGIVGLGKACELAAHGLDEFREIAGGLRDRMERELLLQFPWIRVNGGKAERAPHVSNLSFPGLRGESLLVALDFAGIAVSTGAACASGAISPSHVLVAMGLDEAAIQSAIRFSLSRLTESGEIDYALGEVRGIVERMRHMAGLGSD